MPRSIDRHEVQQLIAEQQAQLVEVLPAAEYADEHLPGAINIPPRNSTAKRRAGSTRLDR
jgi:rhodanese-related sulfurtransferase